MTRHAWRWTRPLLLACLVAACADAPPSATPGAPTDAAPPAASATVPAGPSTAPSADPGATTTPTEVAPTPEPLVLGGAWIRPRDGSILAAYRTTLVARPSATGDGVTTFTKVVFRVRRAGGDDVVACVARVPRDDGTYACAADLLALGIPPGPVRLSFDVFGEGVPMARTPDGTLRVDYAVPPPRPADATWTQVGSRRTGRYERTLTYRVTWSLPAGYASEVLLYDTWECPRTWAGHHGEDCFVAGTPVDTSQLQLLGSVAGTKRSMEVDVVQPECGPAYGTVLLRARNDDGRSAFAIIEAARIPNPRDTIC